MLRPLQGTRPFGFASPLQFLTGASGLTLPGAELRLDEWEVQDLLHSLLALPACATLSLSACQLGYSAVCTQISGSFLPLPFCLPLGLQERLRYRLQARTPSLYVWVAAVASPRAEESWARQEIRGWRCCSFAWSREDPLKGIVGLLGNRCDLMAPSLVEWVL